MSKVRLTIIAAIFLTSIAAAPPASAYWTFLTYDYPTFAMCTGEQDYPYGGSSCDVTTSWGSRIATSSFQGKCAASIWCQGGIVTVKTCLANENPPWALPSICWASTSSGTSPRAVCKSQYGGSWSLRCQ